MFNGFWFILYITFFRVEKYFWREMETDGRCVNFFLKKTCNVWFKMCWNWIFRSGGPLSGSMEWSLGVGCMGGPLSLPSGLHIFPQSWFCCRVMVHSCTCFTIMVQSGFDTATFRRNARYEFLSGNVGELLVISSDWLYRFSFTYIHVYIRFIKAPLSRALQRQNLFPCLSIFYEEILTKMKGVNFWIIPAIY